jgi:hypothetical protein
MERRRRTRQVIALPIEVLEAGGIQLGWTATTRDISFGGVCFTYADPLPVGQRLTYIVTLSQGDNPVRISCSGLIVRCTPKPDQSVFETAVTMEKYNFVQQVERVSISADVCD